MVGRGKLDTQSPFSLLSLQQESGEDYPTVSLKRGVIKEKMLIVNQ